MKNNHQILGSIKIKGDGCFLPHMSSLKKSVYFFKYDIAIKNNSDIEVKLLSRYWIIKDANNNNEFVEGDGVVGEQPVLKVGDSYQYTSFCPLKTSFVSMKGFYTFCDKNGVKFISEIPEFSLVVPDDIN